MRFRPTRCLSRFLPAILSLAALVLAAPNGAAQCDDALEFSSSAVTSNFGHAVDLDGDQVLVGASRTPGVGVMTGSAHLFDASSGAELFIWRPPAGTNHSARFGEAVALGSAEAVIGAPNIINPSGALGAVFVYDRATGLPLYQLTHQFPTTHSSFGRKVAISANWLAVADSRGAQVYALGSATPTLEVDAPTAIFDSIAISGNFLVAGATWTLATGSVQIYDITTGQLVQTLTEPSAPNPGRFGAAIATSAGRVIVGSDNLSGLFPANPAYVYDISSGVRIAELVATGLDQGPPIGRVVDLDGDRALVGGGWFTSRTAISYDVSSGVELARFRGTELSAFGLGVDVALDGDRVLLGTHISQSGVGAALLFSLDDALTPYCHCAANAPCANADSAGGCANSTGVGGRLVGCGLASVASDELVLHATELPAGQSGLVFMGGSPSAQPFGDGQSCVASGMAGVFRFPLRVAHPVLGEFSEGPGVAAASQSFAVAGHIAAGQSWHFQAWYRDPSGPCGSGFNFTNALQIVFQP